MSAQTKHLEVKVEHFDTVSPALLAEFVDGLSPTRAQVSLVAESGPGRGSMGWLAEMATTVAVLISQAFLQELVHDGYKSFKDAVIRMWNGEIHEPGFSNKFSMRLSLIVHDELIDVKVLFAPDATGQQIGAAIDKLKQHVEYRSANLSTSGLPQEPSRRGELRADEQEILLYDPNADCLTAIGQDSE